MRALPLGIAFVAPCGELRSMVDELASGLAARGHRVRVYDWSAGYERVLRGLRAGWPDVVSQHAGDPQAFALAEGLPVLHTLHVPPTAPLLAAARAARASFAAPFSSLVRAWRAAGLERIRLIPAGVPEPALPPAVVRPIALVADRTGAVAAWRAGVGIAIQTTLAGRRDLARKLAHSAVCIAAASQSGAFDRVVALAQLAGCPVVGYAQGALPEMVEQDVSGILVAPEDEQALAAAVRRALALQRHRVRASARGRLLLETMLDRYESELRALARRSTVRLVA